MRFAQIVAFVLVAGALAGGASGGTTNARPHIGGIVVPPSKVSIGQIVGSPGFVCSPYVPFCEQLTYHGGVVMHQTTTHAIFWLPTGYSSGDGMSPFDPDYESTIDQYFQDLAASSGGLDNVYGVATQYYDQPGANHITTNQVWGGSWVDTATAFPSSGCTDSTGEAVKCLTDDQLQAEVDHAITVNGWPRDTSNIYFLFTPEGINSCFDSGSTACGYTEYCAYHGSFLHSGQTVVYANQPYPALNNNPNWLCGTGEYPNGTYADPSINVVSHEHNEAITDPNLDAWWASGTGAENGDQCAWFFGTEQGPSGGHYNQTINGHHYDLQLEWSNSGSTCLAGYGAPVSAPFIKKYTKHAPIGWPVTVSGSNFTGISTVKIGSTSQTFDNGKKLTFKVATGTTDGDLVLHNAGGDSNAVPFVVDPSPAPQVKSVPKQASVGDTITIKGKNLWGADSVTINGTACGAIAVTKSSSLTCVVGGGTTSGTVTVHTPGGPATSTKTITIV